MESNVSELNSNLGGLNFAQDAEGNWGYIPTGADSVIPFKNSFIIPKIVFYGDYNKPSSYFYFPKDAKKITFTIDPSSNQNGGSAFSLKAGSTTIASSIIGAKTYTYDLLENSYLVYGCGSPYVMTITNMIIYF